MGIFDKLRGEFIDIVEWLDPTNDTLVYRFERYQNEIKMGAKLTVRESQVAAFVNEGQLADVYQPGMYTLQTQNMPLLSTLKGWKYGFNSPFKAEVYFVSMRQFTDLGWGTKNPIMLRDPEFGPLRLRANGTFAIKVKDPTKLIRTVAGTDGQFTTDEIIGQLVAILATRATDVLGSCKIPALDLASNYDELSEMMLKKVGPEFEEYGLDLTKFLFGTITLPEEVEKALDKRTSMGVIGNLNNYTQFQAANAMEAAATNPGGAASAGMGMGMGFGMAQQMAQSMNPQQQQQQAGAMPPPLPNTVQFFAVVNGQQAGPYNDATLRQMIQMGSIKQDTMMWKQGMSQWTAASQIPELISMFGAVPPPLPPQ